MIVACRELLITALTESRQDTLATALTEVQHVLLIPPESPSSLSLFTSKYKFGNLIVVLVLPLSSWLITIITPAIYLDHHHQNHPHANVQAKPELLRVALTEAKPSLLATALLVSLLFSSSLSFKWGTESFPKDDAKDGNLLPICSFSGSWGANSWRCSDCQLAQPSQNCPTGLLPTLVFF